TRPHQPASAASIAARPASMASPRRSGSRPPAWAIVSRPPPPPPAISAAPLGVAPAGLGHRVAPATATSGDLGRDLDDGSSLHTTLHQRRSDTRNEVNAPVRGAPQQDRRIAQETLHAIDC